MLMKKSSMTMLSIALTALLMASLIGESASLKPFTFETQQGDQITKNLKTGFSNPLPQLFKKTGENVTVKLENIFGFKASKELKENIYQKFRKDFGNKKEKEIEIRAHYIHDDLFNLTIIFLDRETNRKRHFYSAFITCSKKECHKVKDS